MAKRDQKSILVRMPKTLKRRLAREVAPPREHAQRRRGRSPRLRVRRRLHAQRPARACARARPAPSSCVSRQSSSGSSTQPRASAAAARTSSSSSRSPSGSALHSDERNDARETAVRTARRGRTARFASRSSASATAPTRSSRESSTTRTHPPDEFVPGLMHVDLGGYHVRDVEFTAAFDVTKAKVGKDLADAIWAEPNDTIKFATVPKTGITVSRGMTHDGIGKYISEVVEKAPGRHGRRCQHPQGDGHGRRRQLPPRRLRGGDEVVRGADPERGLRDGELHAGLHRQGRLLRRSASRIAGCRSSATTSSRRSARRSRTAC